MSNFVKVYDSILDSSIWLEPDHVLRLFLTMLLQADPRGMVEASPAGLARRANLDRERFDDALAKLEGPDPDSKTPDNEGRRVKRVPGGWFIYNYRMYRERGTSTERVKRFRAKGKGEFVTDETPETPLSSSLSSSGTTEKREEKRDVTGETHHVGRNGNGVLALGELVQRIRGLAQKPPQGPMVIPSSAVEALGADIYRAYRAVGGSPRFLEATGKDYSWLVKEFGQALIDARTP